MYQYLLFDLDGTLTDSKPGIINSILYALEFYGIDNHDPDFLNQFVGPPLTVSFQEFCGFTPEQAEEGAAKYRERYAVEGIFENSAYPGIVEALKTLKEKGFTIATATSKPEPYLLKIIERFGLAPYIDVPVGATFDESRRNKTQVIEEALLRLHIDTEEKKAQTLMIGDRFHDIVGAKNCNLDSLGCEWGYAVEGELKEAGATYVIDTVADLVPFLMDEKKHVI